MSIMGALKIMRENQEPGSDALRSRMCPPIECARAMKGGWQSGSTISFMKCARSWSNSPNERT